MPDPAATPPAVPRSGAARGVLGYLVAAGLAAAGAAVLFRVGFGADVRVPLAYDGDGFYYLAMNKTIAETGWYYFNDRVGQPGGLDARDFPTGDGWAHVGLVWLLIRLGLDPFAAANVFFLLTFPLTAVTTLFVGRRLGLSLPSGLLVAALYTFQPYHTARLGHPYLAAYYFVPLAVLLAVRHYQGRLPFRRRTAGGPRWTARTPAAVGALVIAALLGAGGIYYAFFAGWFVMVAGCVRAYADRRWAPAVSAGVVCVVMFAVLAATMSPPAFYRATEPRNSDTAFRRPSESEEYGLKVVQMLMPVTGHRVGWLRAFKSRYLGTTPLVNENDMASLGTVGAVGFVALTLRLFLRRPGPGKLFDGLAILSAVGVLLATIGGYGAVVAWYLTPWIRAYNRISIFLALFALLAVGLLLDSAGRRFGRGPVRRTVFTLGLGGLAAAGLYDQTTPRSVRAYREAAAQFRTDREFVARVEADAPAGGLVFQLPHGGYPERLFPDNNLPTYEMFRPYLHSAHLKWSYGGLAGHFGDEWAQGLARRPVPDMLVQLAEAGAVGVYVNRNAYLNSGDEVEADVRAALGALAPAESADAKQAYYDLRPFAARLRASVPAAEWDARSERAQNPVVPLWRNGFHPRETPPAGGTRHWCAGSGELHLNNALPRPRTVRLRFRASRPAWAGRPDVSLRAEYDGWSEEVAIGHDPRAVERVLTLPPGNTVVRLACPAPALVIPAIPRRDLVFAVDDLECDELP